MSEVTPKAGAGPSRSKAARDGAALDGAPAGAAPDGTAPVVVAVEAAPNGAAPGAGGVTLDGVSIRYPGRREVALEVSLGVAPGELVGVAGRTGAGKSTLALTAGGFVPRVVRARVAGSVRIDGLDALTAGGSELAGRVGIVFSTPANQLSASKLTVREELAFGLENLAVPRAEMDGRIDDVLDRLSIAHLAERDPFTLSGGEQQRVAIASILAMGTSVLVLDEPVAQLDPAGSRGVAALLRRLAAEGRAVLCIEHDPEILAATGRCLILESGRAVALDRPGAALGSAVQEPLGLRPPTLVSLAELAGLPPDLAFDEDAVAAALGGLSKPGAGASGSPQSGPGRHSEPARQSGPAALEEAGGPGQAAPRREASPQIGWAPIRTRSIPTLAARGLVYRYPGGPEVLRGVELIVRPGEAVAIVGQNGSGKTTLAKHLDGLLRPAAGSVEIDGRDIRLETVGSIAGTVGFVFQNPDDQLFNRSVEREIAFGPRSLGLDGRLAHELVDHAIELAGLAPVRSVNPYDLGLSVRKLVALASVLAIEPAILVLDEPTTGQDGPGAARIGAIVEAYHRAGRTVVAITHDMEFAAEHFGRVVVMREGGVVADGSPAEVFAPDVADLIAATGLVPPVAARLGARLGLGPTPTLEALLAALAFGA